MQHSVCQASTTFELHSITRKIKEHYKSRGEPHRTSATTGTNTRAETSDAWSCSQRRTRVHVYAAISTSRTNPMDSIGSDLEGQVECMKSQEDQSGS